MYCISINVLILTLLVLAYNNISQASAVTEESCVDKDKVSTPGEESGKKLSNKDNIVKTDSKSLLVDEVIESIGNSEIYEGRLTTVVQNDYVTPRAKGGESEAVYYQPLSETPASLKNIDKDKKENIMAYFDTNCTENIKPLPSITLENSTSDNHLSPIHKDMTADVEVEDFMTSRISDNESMLDSLKLIKEKSKEGTSMEDNVDYEDSDIQHINGSDNNTVEESDGKYSKSKNDTQLTKPNTNRYEQDVISTDDNPRALKLTMDNPSDNFISEKTTISQMSIIKNSYKSMVNYTTDTTTEGSLSTNPLTVKNSVGEQINQENSSLKLEEESDKNFKSTDDIVSKEQDSQLGSPKSEKLYSFGIEKEITEEKDGNKVDEIDYKSRSEEIRLQLLRDYQDKSEEDKIAIKNLLPDYPNFKKEKIDPGVLFEDCLDCDFRILPIRPSEQRNIPFEEEKEESLPSPSIRFGDPPDGRELQIYTLGLSDGFFIFSYLSEFLKWIQPNEFPVELVRDALKSQITWISLIMQSLQVEAGFVVCILLGVLLALAVPVLVLSHACYRVGGHEDDCAEDKVGWAGNCRRRTLVFILQILLVLLLGGMVAMFVTNEQLSGAVMRSNRVIQTSLGDVSAFVHNSHLQLHFLVTQSLDQVLKAVHADLDNVDTLLGQPIQRELVKETGIDVALESLSDLTRGAKETTAQVERLLDEVRVVQEMVISTRDKLSDLRQQVELFRRACGPRDRTLCDTIDASGLDVILRLDSLKSDDRLHRMRRMGGVGLEAAAAEARERFMSVPSKVEADTRDAREAVRRQLTRQRADVDDRSIALEQFTRDLSSKINEAQYDAGFWLQDLDQYEYWRWIICMGGGAAVFMIWVMLFFSLCCGCCGSEKAAGPTILVTIILVCLLSTLLWTVALIGLLVGGHGEVFVCRPLYDDPEFHLISRLVDQPGVFYSEPRGGFIANVIYGNDTLDVPVQQVLQECRKNHALYPTLSLGRIFDVEASVDPHRWSSVTTSVRSIRANLSSLEILSPALQDQLQDLLATLSVNFTEHRIQMSKPVIGKDMDSFARQLDNIGNQMRDLATASRMETLSSRTRRLIDSHIRPLEGRKDALVYQLTALEVQTGPLQRQVNQSLSHLKTIQFFINNQGESIAHRKSRQYVDRLLSYVDQLRRHVMDAVTSTVAPCKPLWDIFDTTRLFLCHHVMDSLNGYWFATMWCLVVLLIATPVCLKLVDYYRAQGSRPSGSPSENLMVSEQGAGWSSPGYDIKYSKEHNGHCQ